MDDHDHTEASGCCGSGGGSKSAGPLAAATAKDPVCGMKVDPATSKHRFEHGGTTYHFCSAGCRTKFAADPDKYLAPEGGPGAGQARRHLHLPDAPARSARQGPGSCPICGMALEPVEVTAEAPPNHELADMTRRFWIGLVLALPVFILEMGSHIPASAWTTWCRCRPPSGSSSRCPRRWCCGRAGRSSSAAGRRLVSRHLNMFTLIALGTGAAYLYSLAATFAPGLLPGRVPRHGRHGRRLLRGRRRHHRAGPAGPGAGAARARADRRRHPRAAEPGAQDGPAPARRRRRRGDPARAGRRSATGCASAPATACRWTAIVLEGRSAVDESMVTGESMPSAKETGGKLIGGTVNGTGSLVMRAEKVGADTMLAPHRRHGGGGAAQPGADPAAGRHGGGLVRAGRAAGRRRWPSRRGRSGDRRRRCPTR